MKIAAIAAVVSLLSVTAFAVGIHLFYNPTIVENRDDAFAQQADQAGTSGAESGSGSCRRAPARRPRWKK